LQDWILTPDIFEFHCLWQNVLDMNQVLEKKSSSKTNPRYNIASILLCCSFVEPIQEFKKRNCMRWSYESQTVATFVC
jgi:hypothetical protein